VLAFAAADDHDLLQLIAAEVNDSPNDAPEEEPEFYVNDNLTFTDGEVIETRDGRKLRISLTEVDSNEAQAVRE
jgi:hypothetical protein